MDMDLYEAHDYEALLNTCFEIEGLLTLMRYRQEESPMEVYDLLKIKVASIARELGVAAGNCEAEAAEVNEEIAASVEYEESGDADIHETVDQNLPAETVMVDCDTVEAEKPMVVFGEEPAAPELLPQQPVEPTPLRVADEQPVVQPMAAHASLFDELSSTTGNIERMDAKVARQATGDLMSAITRNDLVRFRRELFGNSDIMFSDTIHTISAMHSYEEAEEYLYGDMGWNPQGDDVVDFMAIVKNYFGAR